MFLVVGESLSFRMAKTSTTHTKWLPKHPKLSPNKCISTEFGVKFPAYHRSTVNNFTFCPVRLPTKVGLFQLVGLFQSFKFVNTFHAAITMILIHIITVLDVSSTCTVPIFLQSKTSSCQHTQLLTFKFVNTFHAAITMILKHIITILDVSSTCTVPIFLQSKTSSCQHTITHIYTHTPCSIHQ